MEAHIKMYNTALNTQGFRITFSCCKKYIRFTILTTFKSTIECHLAQLHYFVAIIAIHHIKQKLWTHKQ
jgi:hypothetical protein